MSIDATGFRELASRPQPRRFRRPNQIAFGLLLGGCLLLVTGCATTLSGENAHSMGEVPPEPPSWAESNDLVRIETEGHGLFLVRPDHQLGRYDDLLISNIGFRYSDNQSWLSSREEERIRSMIRNAVQGTEDGAIGLASDVGPCVLAVEFYVADLEIFNPSFSSSGSQTSIVRSFGKATMIMELRDSVTDERLARFVQKRSLGGGIANSGTDSSLRRLGRVLGVAMRDMGTQIQRITPPTAGGWDKDCKGNMTRIALGAH